VDSEQWTVDSGQWTVKNGQFAVNNGQFAVSSRQCTVGNNRRQWTLKFSLAISKSFYRSLCDRNFDDDIGKN
jgi:hypothetical protein